MATDVLLTTQQLADLLQIPVDTLYAWRSRGEGPPAYRLGKHLRFRAAEVSSWLERHGSSHAADPGQVVAPEVDGG
jgi:excisionase family DNA binding protein